MESNQIGHTTYEKVCNILISIQNGFGNQKGLPPTIESKVTIIDARGQEFPCDATRATNPEVIMTALLPKLMRLLK